MKDNVRTCSWSEKLQNVVHGNCEIEVTYHHTGNRLIKHVRACIVIKLDLFKINK